MSDPRAATVTFLFTDIQGSTSMWERDAKRMQAALARHDEIMRGVVAAHGGRVFKMVGDACYAAFPDAPKALEAALAAQKAIFAEPWDERCRLRVRMALHTGAVEERDGDYFGPPLNRVARLLSAGHGGQTLVSRATRELADGRLPDGVSVRDMGERRLKDLKEPERIFQLLAPDLPTEFPPLKTLETSSNEDRYRLIKQIGSGGMAEVYLAYDEFLQREVAFKVLDRKHAENKEAVERFRREARNAASLHHPNIVATHDRGETEDGTYYIVMEYLEGGTLQDLVEERGPLPAREAAEIAVEIADALRVAHEGGVIHRDIKPQNVLLTKSGEAKVADFGIARAASATTMTQLGSVLGTVHYISPEQALGEPATPQSDLYSLGVVLYQMLTGELPYDAETPVGIIMKHVSGLPRSPRDANPDVPEELDALVSRLLSRVPEERPADASTLVEELEGIVEGLPEVSDADRTRGARTAGGRGTRTTRSGTSGTSGRSGRRLGTGAGAMRAASAGAPGRSRQRVGVLVAMGLVLASIGVIAFVAFTRGGAEVGTDSEPSAQAKPIPVPPPDQVSAALAPGRYATDDFDIRLSFRVGGGDGWRVSYAETSDTFEMTTATATNLHYPSFSFTTATEIFLPSRQESIIMDSDERKAAAPDDLVGWLRDHPNLETSEPEPVTVGGISGQQFDVSVSPAPEDHSPSCGPDPCVLLLGFVEGGGLWIWEGDRMSMIVLDDIEDETLVIAVTARPDEFDGLLSKAEEVLETVEWDTATASSAADAPAPADALAQTIPTEGPIEPGAYRSDEFEPSFSYDLDEGWSVYGDAEKLDIMSMGLSDTLESERPSLLGFYRPAAVVDPEDPSGGTLLPAPNTVDEWVDWFREHPHLDVEEPVPVTVAGISGMRIDQTVSSVPEGLPALPMWTHEDGFEIRDEKGARGRLMVLEVEGEPLLIDISAADNDSFDQLLPKAEEALDTLEWGGS